jgi:hypothetical protein
LPPPLMLADHHNLEEMADLQNLERWIEHAVKDHRSGRVACPRPLGADMRAILLHLEERGQATLPDL